MKGLTNKILNIFIICLIIGIFCFSGYIGLQYYNSICDVYNENILNFTVNMLKGNVSLKDIDSLDANDTVKTSLKEYYNSNFYTNEDSVILYNDYNYFIENKDKIAEMQKEYGIDILDSECVYFLSSYDENATDVEIKFFNLSMMYIDLLKDKKDDRVYIEDNCLKIKVVDLLKEDETIIYDGLNLKVFKDSLSKNIKDVCLNSEKFYTLEIVKQVQKSSSLFVYIRNIVDTEYILKCELSFNKIKNMEISN